MFCMFPGPKEGHPPHGNHAHRNSRESCYVVPRRTVPGLTSDGSRILSRGRWCPLCVTSLLSCARGEEGSPGEWVLTFGGCPG